MDTTTSTDGTMIPYTIFQTAHELGERIADRIAGIIREQADQHQHCVLCLPTGSTPVVVYKALVDRWRNDGLSFDDVTIVNWDEYYPMDPADPRSYRSFMIEHLLGPIGFDLNRFFIPQGNCSRAEIEAHCEWLEALIKRLGGFRYVLAGLGYTGHLGFNEPGSSKISRTRLVDLHEFTRRSAAGDFFGLDKVPKQGITLGLGTILRARTIDVIVTSENKANAAYRLLEGVPSIDFPATCLYEHPGAHVFLDAPAASKLTAVRTPWRVGQAVDWSDQRNVVRAAAVLIEENAQPLSAIQPDEPGLEGLREHLNGTGLVEIVQNHFRAKLRGLNGAPIFANGKPARVVVCAPHPDDAEIQLGVTIRRLIAEGCDVYVAAMTTGNIAVWDSMVRRFATHLDLVQEALGIDAEKAHRRRADILSHLARKETEPLLLDTPDVLRMKAWIRENEMITGLSRLGVRMDRIHFLRMPFYETGGIRKQAIDHRDIGIVEALLRRLDPDVVFAAGDLTDPHGTHRVCLDCLSRVRNQLAGEPWARKCQWLLYRGAWQEWEPEQIDLAVPFDGKELAIKMAAIHCHSSQVPKAMFAGIDPRPFDKRVQTRNRETAEFLRAVGVLGDDVAGVEAFRNWDTALRV